MAKKCGETGEVRSTCIESEDKLELSVKQIATEAARIKQEQLKETINKQKEALKSNIAGIKEKIKSEDFYIDSPLDLEAFDEFFDKSSKYVNDKGDFYNQDYLTLDDKITAYQIVFFHEHNKSTLKSYESNDVLEGLKADTIGNLIKSYDFLKENNPSFVKDFTKEEIIYLYQESIRSDIIILNKMERAGGLDDKEYKRLEDISVLFDSISGNQEQSTDIKKMIFQTEE